MRDSATLNLHSASIRKPPCRSRTCYEPEQVVQLRKMSGLIVRPPNFDSWESPKAHPQATTSVFESRAAVEKPWLFRNLPLIAL